MVYATVFAILATLKIMIDIYIDFGAKTGKSMDMEKVRWDVGGDRGLSRVVRGSKRETMLFSGARGIRSLF